MKRKTLIAMSVASTVGVAAFAFAGSTPFPMSASEVGPTQVNHQTTLITWDTNQTALNLGSTSSQAGGIVSSDSLSGDQLQLSANDATLALADQGIYSDFYSVSLAPGTFEQWDYYTLTPLSQGSEFYVIEPAYSVVMFSDFDNATPAM